MFSLVFLIDELFEILFYDGLHLLVRSCRSPRKRKRVRRKIQIKETCFAAELILFYSIAFNNVGNSLLKLSSTNRYIFIISTVRAQKLRGFALLSVARGIIRLMNMSYIYVLQSRKDTIIRSCGTLLLVLRAVVELPKPPTLDCLSVSVQKKLGGG